MSRIALGPGPPAAPSTTAGRRDGVVGAVMLTNPEGIEAYLIGELDLRHQIADALYG